MPQRRAVPGGGAAPAERDLAGTRGRCRSALAPPPPRSGRLKGVLLPPAAAALPGEPGFNLAAVRANAQAVCQD